jgi:hypothetical protein
VKLSEGQRKSFTTTAERYHETVAGAASYLGPRALWDPAITSFYLLGHVTEPAAGDEDFAGRLVIPYLTPAGVVNLKFRCIEPHDCKQVEHHAKYLGYNGAGDRVYNVRALRDAGARIYVSEGELDALSSTVAGCPCIGISGANKWQPHYGKLLEDFDDVVIFADGDKPGRDFGKRIRSELNNARIVYFPEGEDANSVLATGTVAEFRDLVGA